ncbi:MAG: hypothetical protein L0Z62_03815 [Gemmataceae bacterium]|nr:hypothetical protein [Gemmataceae bacterium]
MAKNGHNPKGKAPTVKQPTGPLVIYVGRQGHGVVYELSPASHTRIRTSFPEARPAAFLNLAYHPTPLPFEALHGPTWGQVALLLTGLTAEQLQTLGGIRLHDPQTETTWDVPALVAQG